MNNRSDPQISIKEEIMLSNEWRPLKRFVLDYVRPGHKPERQIREVYERGNGAAILLYNLKKNSLILTRQFRLPTYINGNPSGMMVEVCAGLLENENPEDCIQREVFEETGYKVNDVEKVYQAYMTPGADTELLHFFIAEYDESMKKNEGGGLDEEQEDIEVLEWDIEDAFTKMQEGLIKDAKSIILLQHLKIRLLQSRIRNPYV